MSFAPYVPLSEQSLIDVPEYPQNSPSTAPKFTKHRTVADAVDTGVITTRKWGMNMSGFDKAIVRVLPQGGANPNIEILFWSEEAGAFVADASGLTATGKGVDVPYDFTCEVNNRIIFVYVTGTVAAADTVEILVAGFRQDRLR